ncbi:hypothetical protein ACIPYS_04975 [Kitasatospora sp. NPDC089913]|uniref:hypothetical protein n=1 Tax=Kitasatospora sp. NPDC089913 TaxID=3364080 RepID=UPI003805467B
MPRGTGRPAGRAVVPALLASVVAAASVLLAPAAGADTSLRLNPGHGAAGTGVTIDGAGFGDCLPDTKSVRLRWDTGTDLGTGPIGADGSIHASFTVPASARPAPHRVTASCRVFPRPNLRAPEAQGLRGPFDLTASATFTVDPAAPGVLTLDPASGTAGRTFVAHGSGFACPAGEPVVLRWEQRELGRVAAPDGTFEQRLTAPPDAPPGAHPVAAACEPSTDHATSAAFTVLAAPGSGAPAGPLTGPSDKAPAGGPAGTSNGRAGAGAALRVEPGAALPGQPVVLTGSGYACRGGEAELTWNGVVWEHVGTGSGGGFTVTTRIADDARPGRYHLRAVCPAHPEADGRTDFEVLSAETGGGSGSGSGGGSGDASPTALVVGPTAGGAVLLTALAGTYVLGRRRGPSWASAHVSVAPVAGEPPRPRVEEAADPAGPGLTVRLEPRPDPGTHRVEETPGRGTPSQEAAGEGAAGDRTHVERPPAGGPPAVAREETEEQ